MNPKQLKTWKLNELEKERIFFEKKKAIFAVNDVYPEFKFEKPYTTALDGYLPIGVLLPFFKRVNVGIFPYLKNENEFYKWYGLYPNDLLWLYHEGRVNLRILFPHALSSIPKYLNPFFELNLPTTLRDANFTKRVLGDKKLSLVDTKFDTLFQIKNNKSIDNFTGNRKPPSPLNDWTDTKLERFILRSWEHTEENGAHPRNLQRLRWPKPKALPPPRAN